MRLHAALLAVLALGACGKGTAVVVNVTSAGPLTVDHLAVDASIGTAMRTFTVPLEDKMFPPEHSFVIDVGNDRSGTLDVTVDAQSAGGGSLGKASGSVMLVHGKQVSIELTLGSAPDGGVGTDGDVVDDAALACGTTTTSCSGTSLVTTCGTSGQTSSVTCPLGCVADATPPRCTQVVPTAPVLTSDVYGTDVTADLTLPTGTVVFDTQTGAIIAGTTTLRGPNTGTMATRAVQSGIAFSIVPNQSLPDSNMLSQAIWSFHSLAIPAGTNVFFAGNNAIGFTSADTVTVGGNLAVMAYAAQGATGTLCARQYASPGGGGGDQPSAADSFFGTGGNGVEFSGTSVYWGGGGGGGFGAPGGTGAYTSTVNNGSTPGTTYGNAALSPIIGGSAGGWADDEEVTDSGAGGGAIQIVAATSVAVSGTINAGGCGGTGSNTGGSGGGSGGAILIETPQLSASANAILAVNGGGGGASGCLTNGSNALASGSPAPGGLCDASHGSAGGAGGAATTAAGTSANQVGPINTTYYGGGGGGGVGRIRFNVASQPTLSTATISPPPASAYTTQGTLATQ